MATDLERLVISLDANITGLSRKLARATGDVDSFGRNADRSTRRAAQKIQQNLDGAFRPDQLRNLSFQLNDVLTGVFSGQPLKNVAAQQGGQIFQALQDAQGGVKAGVADLGKRFAGLVLSARGLGLGVAAGAGVAAAAFAKWEAQSERLANSLNGLGRRSGLTMAGLATAAEQGRLASGGTFGGLSMLESRDLAAVYNQAGVFGGNISGAVAATRTFAGASGQSLEDAGAQIAKFLSDPKTALGEFEKSLGAVNAQTRNAVERAVANGDLERAQALIIEELNRKLRDVTDNAFGLSKVFRDVGQAASNAFAKVGREIGKVLAPSLEEQLETKKSALAKTPSFGAGSADVRKRLENEIAAINKQIAERDAATKKRAADDAAARASQEQDAYDKQAKANALEVEAIGARTVAERAAIAAEQARTEAIRAGLSDMRAEQAARQTSARAMAEATRQAQDAIRDAKDAAIRAGLPPAAQREFDRQRQYQRNQEQFGGVGAAAPSGAGVSVKPYAPGPGAGDGYGGAFSKAEVVAMIRASASKYGINPDTAVAVARSEGLSGYVGDKGTSFGPYQLHYKNNIPGLSNAGLGDVFTHQTGLDARNPGTVPQQIDFALKVAAQQGWGPWHGAANTGIAQWAGIGGRAGAAPAPSPVPSNVSSAPGRVFDYGRQEEANTKARQYREEQQDLDAAAAANRVLADSYGASAEKIAEMEAKQRLLNAAIKEYGSLQAIPAERMQQIDVIAARQGQIAGVTDQLQRGQAAASQFSDSLADGLVNVAFNGGKVSAMLKGIAAQLASMALRNLFTGGGQGGGLLTGILGGATGGGGGGLFGLLGGLHFADGGQVPGAGGPRSDNVLARLSPGEYVVNAKAAGRHGALLQAINTGRLPRFADGGPVGAPVSIANAVRPASASGPTINHSTTLNVTPANGVTPEQLAVVIERNNRQRDRAIGQTMNNWQSRYA